MVCDQAGLAFTRWPGHSCAAIGAAQDNNEARHMNKTCMSKTT